MIKVENFTMHFDGETYACKAPCSMYSVLFENGKIENPYYRDNANALTWLAEKDCKFVAEFDLPKDVFQKENLQITFSRVDTLADIYINGRFFAHIENAHRDYVFDGREFLCVGKNKVEIEIFSPIEYILKKNGDMRIISNGILGGTMDGYSHMRKPDYSFGWDWGPQLPDMGIYGGIFVRAFDNKIDRVSITQKHKDGHVDVKFEVETFTGKGEVKAILTAPSGETQETTILDGRGVLRVENPLLWQANGIGEQPLYDVKVVLIENGEEVDCWEKRIGLRTLTVSFPIDEYGREFCFVLNGHKIFSFGACYVPMDNLYPLYSKERTRKLLEDCKKANFNCVRVWGGGFYPDDDFYDACDELGLIVFSDMMLACQAFFLSENFHENIYAEAVEQVKRIHHHACLGLICGNNEMERAAPYWHKDCAIYENGFTIANDYFEFCERDMRSIMEEYAPDTFYWPSSPSGGGGGYRADDENYGDFHYWGNLDKDLPLEEFRDHYMRFCSEFGFQAFPDIKTIESFSLESDRSPNSYIMEDRQKRKGTNAAILKYIANYYTLPTDFKRFVYLSQCLQADNIFIAVEHLRANRGRCMGMLYWQLNDCWPAISWSSIDYYGRWKGMHYEVKRAYNPLFLALVNKEKFQNPYFDGKRTNTYELTAVFVNDLGKDEKLTAEVYIADRAFNKVYSEKTECTVKAFSKRDVCLGNVEEYVLGKERELFIGYVLYKDGEKICENARLFVPAKHFDFVHDDFTCKVEKEGDRYALKIKSGSLKKRFAIWSKLELSFSDNYFDIVDASEKTVYISGCADKTVEEIEKSLTFYSL